jgi:amino acid transporter
MPSAPALNECRQYALHKGLSIPNYPEIARIIPIYAIDYERQGLSLCAVAYWQELLSRAFWDAWQLVVVRSIGATMIAVGIFVASYLWLRRGKRDSEAQDRLKKGAEAALFTALAFALIFLANFLFFTPQKMVLEARAKVQSPPTPTPAHNEREWPPLTEAQIQEWVAALKPNHPPEMVLVLFESDVEANEFFRSVKTVGKRLKWEIYHSGGTAENGASEIQVRSSLVHQPSAQIIAQLLNRMNYPAKVTSEAGNGGVITITIPDKTN